MERFEAKENLPIGGGKEFLETRKEYTLPAFEIKNKVLWINPAFQDAEGHLFAPFHLEKGKASPLGVFFAHQEGRSGMGKVKKLRVESESVARSGLFGSVIFSDREGRKWRDIDAKGIGLFRLLRSIGNFEFEIQEVYHNFPSGEREAFGLLDFKYARRDQKYSRRLLDAGLRTHAVIAILELEEIIDGKRKKIPIALAKSRNLIPQKMRPVIEIRAFATKKRVKHIEDCSFGRERNCRMAIDDAEKLVAQELQKESTSFSHHDYVEWFAETLGRQVAKLRKLYLVHRYLTSHNITLDCRIVDLDSMDEVDNEIVEKGRKPTDRIRGELFHRDYKSALSTLVKLIHNIRKLWRDSLSSFDEERYEKTFRRAYHEELKRKGK